MYKGIPNERASERAKSNRGHVIYSAHHAAIIGGFHKLGFEAYVEDTGIVNKRSKAKSLLYEEWPSAGTQRSSTHLSVMFLSSTELILRFDKGCSCRQWHLSGTGIKEDWLLAAGAGA
jgi:hypothetical protein